MKAGAKIPRCSYCSAPAEKWFGYTGYLARAGRSPFTPRITVGACRQHADCLSFVSSYQIYEASGRLWMSHAIYADDVLRWRAAAAGVSRG